MVYAGGRGGVIPLSWSVEGTSSTIAALACAATASGVPHGATVEARLRGRVLRGPATMVAAEAGVIVTAVAVVRGAVLGPWSLASPSTRLRARRSFVAGAETDPARGLY